jgi:hypothetical protein
MKKRFLLSSLLTVAVLFIGASIFKGGPQTEPQPCPTCGQSEVDRDGCTVIMVGKDASADGSVIAAHSMDCGWCDWTFRRIPAADHKPGETRRIYHIDWGETIPPEFGLKWDRVPKECRGPHAHHR